MSHENNPLYGTMHTCSYSREQSRFRKLKGMPSHSVKPLIPPTPSDQPQPPAGIEHCLLHAVV